MNIFRLNGLEFFNHPGYQKFVKGVDYKIPENISEVDANKIKKDFGDLVEVIISSKTMPNEEDKGKKKNFLIK